jgi:hypothetical protein
MSPDQDTDRKILQCVDEVLETLGKNVRQALTRYLERNVGLRREEIPQKPELFRKGLNLILGEHAANILETTIVRKLLTSLELDRKSRLTLVEAIDIIKATQEKSC